MKAALIFIITVLVQMIGLSQQFQLEATIEKQISAIFDIDGDGICEYVVDSNKVYDGATHLLKYTFPPGNVTWDDDTKAENPYSRFPHLDYNNDGKRELIIFTRQPESMIVYDVCNSNILYQFNPVEDYLDFKDLIDIDGDGELEIILRATSPAPSPTKYYVISTGISTSLNEEQNNFFPKEIELKQNFPNPFNPLTTIRYSIKSPENVSIKIYDVSGQLVKEINKEHSQAGEYEVIWNGTSNFGERVSSGAYFYQLSVGDYVEAKKMILLK